MQIISNDGTRPVTTVRKPTEGQARAKYNFVAQSDIELSLSKGELVSLTRRVDSNWFEGRIGNRKGIFPITYVDVLLVSTIGLRNHPRFSLESKLTGHWKRRVRQQYRELHYQHLDQARLAIAFFADAKLRHRKRDEVAQKNGSLACRHRQ